MDLLERKQAMGELLKERRSAEVETQLLLGVDPDGSSWVSNLPNGG